MSHGNWKLIFLTLRYNVWIKKQQQNNCWQCLKLFFLRDNFNWTFVVLQKIMFSVTLSHAFFGGFCLTCRMQHGSIVLSSMECDAKANGYCGRRNYSFCTLPFYSIPTILTLVLETNIFCKLVFKKGDG